MNRLFFFLPILILISISHGKADANRLEEDIATKASSVQISGSESIRIPHWAIQIPAHSFVGISSACPSIEEARQQAVDSAIGQILQTMGADYHLSHESVLSGDLSQSRHEMTERLTYTADWLINSVQQNITEYSFQDNANRHICFALVRMRPSILERLKRLTIGAKVSARIMGISDERATIEIAETNNVRVTMTGYRLTNTVRHDHARLITLFLWKVAESEIVTREEALPSRLSLNGNAARLFIPIPNQAGKLKASLMGSKGNISITITGYDEIGRPVSVSVGNR